VRRGFPTASKKRKSAYRGQVERRKVSKEQKIHRKQDVRRGIRIPGKKPKIEGRGRQKRLRMRKGERYSSTGDD